MSGKKRKMEISTPVSAFSARQRLRGASPKETAPAEPTGVQDNDSSVLEDIPKRPASARKKRSQPRDGQHTSSVAQEPSTPSAKQPSTSGARSMPELTSDGLQNAVTLQLETEATQRSIVLHHSSFRPQQSNCMRLPTGEVTLWLAEGERMLVLGSYGLLVMRGELTIAGAAIRAGDPVSWVHSPHCHAIPVIRITNDAMIQLESNPKAAPLRELEKLNPVFGKMWNKPTADTKGYGIVAKEDTYQIIFTSDDGPKKIFLQELNSPAEWNRKMAKFSSWRRSTTTPVILVCGPKSSGKSTFGRLLANRLVTALQADRKKQWTTVSVLDIDPGQPEYAPPGVISLVTVSKPNLAPSFCHAGPEAGYKTVKSHAIAAVSPGLDAERFVESAVDLFVNYANSQKKDQSTPSPLIVNTPGWVQGTGLDIITTLIQKTEVTEVVYMSQDGPDETVEELKKFCAAKQVPFITLPSQSSEFTSRTALHYRTMQTMSYFHLKSTAADAQQPHWDATPLTEIAPWKVRYKGSDPGILGVMCYDYQPSSSLLAESINGMVVALVEIDDVTAFQAIYEDDMTTDDAKGVTLEGVERRFIERTPEGIPYIQNHPGRPLHPCSSQSLGLALIRGIDARNGEFQLITPIEASVLHAKNSGKRLVLVAGKFDTPSWAYTEDFYRRSYGNWQTVAHEVVVAEEDTDDDASEGDHEDDVGREKREYTEAPWVEMLHGDQKRSVGSRVWRVRRDLGKG